MELTNLAREIHAAAIEKGFWAVEDARLRHEAKMLSELGEVIQADRIGMMFEIERESAKPEGVAAELADYAMMILDYAMQLELPVDRFRELMDNPSCDDLLETISKMPCHELVINLSVPLVKMGCEKLHPLQAFIGSLVSIEAWLKARDLDLWQIIRGKLDYNKSRPALHGRRY